MSSQYLLIIFSLGCIIYFSIGLKKRYYNYKNDPNYSSISVFYSKVAGIILGVIFILLHLFNYEKSSF